MFYESLPESASLAEVGDAALIGAITGWARASAAAEARKLAAIAELERRRCTDALHPGWACDDRDAAAAEVSCALTVGHGRALGQIDLAVTLRDRLPKVGRRFLAGEIPIGMVNTIGWRTALVLDEHALAQLDTEIADHAHEWGPLSQDKLEKAIDFWVQRYDPDAVRRVRTSVRARDFVVGKRDDTTGTTSVHGRLTSTDAALLERSITVMLASVCDDDPRTLGQRRSDAIGAIATRATHLACRCNNAACAGKADDGRAGSVVVHVIADKECLDEPPDRGLHGEGTDAPPAPDEQTEQPEQAEQAETPRRRNVALIPGAKGAIVPAPLLAELIANGAKVRFVGVPTRSEDRYRPSTALQDFVRTRDLTCRFPGCDRPAVHADIDHTRPWPSGTTHPGDLKCYCRLHHLLKTFWDGFTDRQHPDGAVVVTTPSGLSYTTKPLSGLLFPQWNTATPPPPGGQEAAPTGPGRQLMMPTRRRTRAQTRAARIAAERRLNAAERALDAGSTAAVPTRDPGRMNAPYEFPSADYVPDYGDDPPPF
ncbi:MAG: DUF222 domain-containing protein [Mycobacterium sp.]|nr:DUF222 domain-containing protein [Mycobacterium sp.]